MTPGCFPDKAVARITSIKSRLLSILLATLLMVTGSVFALIADEVATMQKAMLDEISTIVADGKSVELVIVGQWFGYFQIGLPSL
jgi:hypothetical protein